MKAVDEGFLRGFDNHRYSGHVWDEYLLAWYWAMTTLTTTGYGDITPSSPREILFCVLAMVIGGFFYGYVVGTIASMVAKSDLNKSAFYDRMEFVHAWLAHHSLPNEMRRRLRRYFRALMERRSAADEAELWCELTQELQMEVGDYIVTETVKANPLFDRLGIGAIVQLQSVLRHVTMEPGQRVATAGEVGTAMFMIEKGVLKLNRAGEEKTTLLGPGESFGEEILLGFKEDYEYTVIVMQRSKLEVIEESDFVRVFQCMPRVMDRMRRNALQLNPEWDETGAKSSKTIDAITQVVPVRVSKGR
jgi:voltage-gated potassium channel